MICRTPICWLRVYWIERLWLRFQSTWKCVWPLIQILRLYFLTSSCYQAKRPVQQSRYILYSSSCLETVWRTLQVKNKQSNFQTFPNVSPASLHNAVWTIQLPRDPQAICSVYPYLPPSAAKCYQFWICTYFQHQVDKRDKSVLCLETCLEVHAMQLWQIWKLSYWSGVGCVIIREHVRDVTRVDCHDCMT